MIQWLMFIYRSSNDFRKWFDHILDRHGWNPGKSVIYVKVYPTTFYYLFLGFMYSRVKNGYTRNFDLKFFLLYPKQILQRWS